MSDLDRYTTLKIPKRLGDVFDKWIELHREELELEGRLSAKGRASRSSAIVFILLRLFKEEGLIQ